MNVRAILTIGAAASWAALPSPNATRAQSVPDTSFTFYDSLY